MTKQEIHQSFPLVTGINMTAQAEGLGLTFTTDQDALTALAEHARSRPPERVFLGYTANMTIVTYGEQIPHEGDLYGKPQGGPFNPSKDLAVYVDMLDERHITQKLAEALYEHPFNGANARKIAGFWRRTRILGGVFLGGVGIAMGDTLDEHTGYVSLAGIGVSTLALVGGVVNYATNSGPAARLRPVPPDFTAPIRPRSKPKQ